jgi:dipeptidyl aminopeptidase/acylaminoacyl peptidase
MGPKAATRCRQELHAPGDGPPSAPRDILTDMSPSTFRSALLAAEMRRFLQGISPLTRADRIRAPLFVLHGANDPRVSASEAAQIVETVRRHRGTVWSLVARDEGHGFQKKRNRDFAQAAVVRFFEEHLLAPP